VEDGEQADAEVFSLMERCWAQVSCRWNNNLVTLSL